MAVDIAWVGFTVRRAQGKSCVIVQDVFEGGPAALSGLQSGDEVISFGGTTTSSLASYRGALKRHAKVGRYVRVEYKRNPAVTTLIADLQVTSRPKANFTNLPPMQTVDNLVSILNDPLQLDTVASAAFVECDDDLSGLVTRKEFSDAMRVWIRPDLGVLVNENELFDIFDQNDRDRSGFLSQGDFTPLMRDLFVLIIRKQYPNFSLTPNEVQYQDNVDRSTADAYYTPQVQQAPPRTIRVPVVSKELFLPLLNIPGFPSAVISGQLPDGGVVAILANDNTITDGSGKQIVYEIHENYTDPSYQSYTLSKMGRPVYLFKKATEQIELWSHNYEHLLTCTLTPSGWILNDERGYERSMVAMYYNHYRMLKWVPVKPDDDMSIWFAIAVIINRLYRPLTPTPPPSNAQYPQLAPPSTPPTVTPTHRNTPTSHLPLSLNRQMLYLTQG